MNELAELRKSNEFLKGVINNIPDPIIVIDSDYRICLANKAVEEIYSGSGQVVSHLCCYEALRQLHRPCDMAYKSIICPRNQVISTKKPSIVKQAFYDALNKVIVMEVAAFPIFNEAGEVALTVETFHHIVPPKWEKEEAERLILYLQEAIAKGKGLSGALTICASCKRIRNDKGNWKNIEIYITEHTEAEFSNGLCHECEKKLHDIQKDG